MKLSLFRDKKLSLLSSLQIVSLASDVSRLDTKSVALELRTAFRVDLVTLQQQQQQNALVSKSVAVKAPAARNVYDALAPVVRRYGFKMYECVVLDVRTTVAFVT